VLRDGRAIRTRVHRQTNRPEFTGTRRYMAAQRRSGIIRALAPAALIVTLAMTAA
jgi:hypothetical protein